MNLNVVEGELKPIKNNVLVAEMNFGEQRTQSGIILRSDDGKTHGVKPRWGRVWAIGPDQHDVAVGDWILVEHGRWTRGVTVKDQVGNEIVIRRVETESILLVTNEKPEDCYIGQE